MFLSFWKLFVQLVYFIHRKNFKYLMLKLLVLKRESLFLFFSVRPSTKNDSFHNKSTSHGYLTAITDQLWLSNLSIVIGPESNVAVEWVSMVNFSRIFAFVIIKYDISLQTSKLRQNYLAVMLVFHL